MFYVAKIGGGWIVMRGDRYTKSGLFLVSKREVNEHVEHNLLDSCQLNDLEDHGAYVTDECPEFHD